MQVDVDKVLLGCLLPKPHCPVVWILVKVLPGHITELPDILDVPQVHDWGLSREGTLEKPGGVVQSCILSHELDLVLLTLGVVHVICLWPEELEGDVHYAPLHEPGVAHTVGLGQAELLAVHHFSPVR